MSKKIKVIDCTKFCRMTSAIRDSEYCNGKARIVDDQIFYGCKEALAEEPKKVRQFYSCQLWDMGLEDSCNVCTLECVNNKNKKIKHTIEQKKKLERLIDDMRPNMMLYGVDANQVEKISSVYTKKNANGERNKLGEEAIHIAGNVNKLLRMVMDGKHVDLSFINLYSQHSIKRLSKLVKEEKARKKKKSS